MSDEELDNLRKTPLLTRISMRNANQVTTVKLVLSNVIRQVTEIETWRKKIDELTERQLAALFHQATEIKAGFQSMRALIDDQEQLDILDAQIRILTETINDVAERLKFIGADMDVVLSELHLVEMAEISLSQALNTFAMTSSEEVRDIQMSADYPGLVKWLESNEAVNIVTALMQTPGDKAGEVKKLLDEALK